MGASAGGLEAFTQLLRRLPLDTGFAFVLVQHLDPQHESALTQLLARATAMPVREVTNNLRVEPNQVYVIPPNTGLGIVRGILKLNPRTKDRAPPRSIDFFFEALAKDQRERAIGVILSGNATDGTIGLEAIKAEGGLTFAQDDSAQCESMPRSAVAAGCVDFVLAPAAIASELARIARHPYVAVPLPEAADGVRPSGPPRPAERPASHNQVARASGASRLSPEDASNYKKILQLLHEQVGVDFSLYKSSTILRRITRRAVLNRKETLAHYAEFLRGNPQEIAALYADALIGVTSFFRNADAFGLLARKVFPRLLASPGDEPLRVWVLGCSTGQEAYSIAMVFTEAAEKMPRPRKLQLFATDLNEASLHKARLGLYARNAVQDVSAERLRRFFVEEEGGFRIGKQLRETVVFARQNVVSDPPFSRMDLISCRNMMIYLDPGLQKKILPIFHYALNPDGFLFLGASESIGAFSDLFVAADRRQKIFRRKAARATALRLPMHQPRIGPSSSRAMPQPGPDTGGAPDAAPGQLIAEREADRVTVNRFAPPSVLINADLQILQFRGSLETFLQPPTGKASFDLLKMARDGLVLPIRAAVERARQELTPVRTVGVALKYDDKVRMVDLEVVPLKNLKERCFLVLFEEQRQNAPVAPDSPPPVAASDPTAHAARRTATSARILRLERDLAETRDYLQSIQEHQETTNEELQATNEEGQSANEELQSLNEELETSKEELESTNEELTTVNEEMAGRNAELNRLNSDLINLQTSTNLVIVLLGSDRTIRRFSAQAGKQFQLATTDLGRPIGSIRHNLVQVDLEAVVGEVIATPGEIEREVRDREGHWYSLRVRPYLDLDHKVDGAVLVLVEVDELKRTELLVTEAHEHAEAIIRTVASPLVILTADLRLRSANPAFYRAFKLQARESTGRSIFDLGHGTWSLPQLRRRLKEVVTQNRAFDGYPVTFHLDPGGSRSLLLNARQLHTPGRAAKEILLGMQDVTDLFAFEADLRRSERRYRRLFEAARDGILIIDPVTRKITDANPYMLRLLGCSRKQLIAKELWQIGLLQDKAANQKAFRELRDTGFIRYENLPLRAKDGTHHEVEFVSNLYDEEGTEVIQCNIRDITERKQAEKELSVSEARFRALFELGPVGVYSCDAKGRIQEYNRCAAKLWGRKPKVGRSGERFSGAYQILFPDGRRMSHATSPTARLLAGAVPAVRDSEMLLERPNGSQITVVLHVVALKNERGETTGAINCFYDLSARKRAEEALRGARTQLANYAANLEEMVAKRTAELKTSNQKLLASIEFVKRGEEQNRVLLGESQAMQKKLQHLTRQILTAQEEERKKISRELHDEVVQNLIGINVELAGLLQQGRASANESHFKARIAQSQHVIAEAVEAIHRFARELRPAVLDDLGLIPALHTYCVNLAERKKLRIAITACKGVESLDADRRAVLFRVAQEALTNIARHAQATHVKVAIIALQDRIRMSIADDGKSFAVNKVLCRKGYQRLGLVGMKERLEMVGGSLNIESARGRGTTVSAEIPVAPVRKPKQS